MISTIEITRTSIGFEFSIKDKGTLPCAVIVSGVRTGGTADLAGLRSGSLILGVNGESVLNESFLEVSNRIRRTNGLTLELTVMHAVTTSRDGMATVSEPASPTSLEETHPRLAEQRRLELPSMNAACFWKGGVENSSRQVTKPGRRCTGITTEISENEKSSSYPRMISPLYNDLVSDLRRCSTIASPSLQSRMSSHVSCPAEVVNGSPVASLRPKLSLKETQPRFLPAYHFAPITRSSSQVHPLFLPRRTLTERALPVPTSSAYDCFYAHRLRGSHSSSSSRSPRSNDLPGRGRTNLSLSRHAQQPLSPTHLWLSKFERYQHCGMSRQCIEPTLGPQSGAGTDAEPKTGRLLPRSILRWMKSFIPEANGLHPLPGSFISRVCLCKVLIFNKSTQKYPHWNRYLLCITIEEFLLIKSSSALFHQSTFPMSTRRVDRRKSSLCLADTFLRQSSTVPSSFGLPLVGLLWHRVSPLPDDLPKWLRPDPMDPFFTASKRPSIASTTASSVDSLVCYRLSHASRGYELLLLFPDSNTAFQCLHLCQTLQEEEKEVVVKSSSTGVYADAVFEPSKPCYMMEGYNLEALTSKYSAGSPSNASKQPQKLHFRRRRSVPVSALKRFGLYYTPTLETVKVNLKVRAEENDFSLEGANASHANRLILASVRTLVRGQTSLKDGEEQPTDNMAELDTNIAALLGEDPDFSTLNNPGPVFGALIEDQPECPYHPNVPVYLCALIWGIEAQDLEQVGLYRKSGRQKVINRFVCLVNMAPTSAQMILSLEAWRDVHALCSLVKLFLRKLPLRIFRVAIWESLTFLIPDSDSDWTSPKLALLLLAIRDRLKKSFNEAISAASIDITSSDPLPVLVPAPVSPPVWRFASLDLLFRHLRRIVARQSHNQISFHCVSVCFGPVLYDADKNLLKWNKLVEVMLQHWPWLLSGLFRPSGDSQASSPEEAHDYAEGFLQNPQIWPPINLPSAHPTPVTFESLIEGLHLLFHRLNYTRDLPQTFEEQYASRPYIF